MALDVPTVVYKKKEKKGLTQRECADLMAQWNERQARKKAEGRDKLNLDEFLGLASKGNEQ